MVFLKKIWRKNQFANKMVLENLDFFQRIQFGTPKCESQILNKNSQNNLRRTPLSYPFHSKNCAKISGLGKFSFAGILQEKYCKYQENAEFVNSCKKSAKSRILQKKIFLQIFAKSRILQMFRKNLVSLEYIKIWGEAERIFYIHITKISLFSAC